jgi:hypothetical protein
MEQQRSNTSILKLAALIAAPLEGVWLWIFSWSAMGLRQTHALAQWLWDLALVIHIPGSLVLVSFGGLTSIYFWPVLFVSGFCEFWVLIAAIIWGWRTARAISAMLPPLPRASRSALK